MDMSQVAPFAWVEVRLGVGLSQTAVYLGQILDKNGDERSACWRWLGDRRGFAKRPDYYLADEVISKCDAVQAPQSQIDEIERAWSSQGRSTRPAVKRNTRYVAARVLTCAR